MTYAPSPSKGGKVLPAHPSASHKPDEATIIHIKASSPTLKDLAIARTTPDPLPPSRSQIRSSPTIKERICEKYEKHGGRLITILFGLGWLGGMSWTLNYILTHKERSVFCFHGSRSDAFCIEKGEDSNKCYKTCYPVEHFSDYCAEGQDFVCGNNISVGNNLYCGIPDCISYPNETNP